MFNIRAIFSIVVVFSLVACGDDTSENTNNTRTNNTRTNNTSTNNTADSIEVIGDWANAFGFDEAITVTTWGTQTIAQFDNETRIAITQNPEDAEFFPSKFDRIVWTPIQDGGFFYCTVVFGQDSLELAQDAEGSADDTNLDEGCSGFPWTKMTRK